MKSFPIFISAHDLADRLIVAFENTKTGLPHPRIHLVQGLPQNGRNDTCTAGAGSLILEMGALSRLLNDPVYESLARRALGTFINQVFL